MTFIFILFSSASFGQFLIGKTEGASTFLESNRYEVIFKSQSGKYHSFYMSKGEIGQDGWAALSKYVKLLFENKEGEYLLQFDEDSVFLIYKNSKVIMELWRKHDSSNRRRSIGFTHDEYLALFGISKYVKKQQ